MQQWGVLTMEIDPSYNGKDYFVKKALDEAKRPMYFFRLLPPPKASLLKRLLHWKSIRRYKKRVFLKAPMTIIKFKRETEIASD